MTIADELIDFFVEEDTQQAELKDRNIELFLHYYGFMDAAFPTYKETGRFFGHTKQNAEPIIKRKLNTLKQITDPLPSIRLLVEIVSSRKYIRSSSLTAILINNGVVANKETCNIKGLLRLITNLGYKHDLGIFDFSLNPIKTKEYSPTAEFLLVEKLIIKKLKEGIAKAKELSGDLGLVSCSYFLEQLDDEYEFGHEICDLIANKEENICFSSDEGETYFHIGGYKKDGVSNILGKVFTVSDVVPIDELTEAIQKRFRKRQINELVKVMLPKSVIKLFITKHPSLVVENGDMVSFIGEKKELNSTEKMAEKILRDEGFVKYGELIKALRKKKSKSLSYSEVNYSPVFSKKKDKNGQRLITLIGTVIEGLSGDLSFDDIIENLELSSQSSEIFNKKSNEAKASGHLGEKFVNQYFEELLANDEILQFTWISKNRPGAPCDFVIQEIDGAVSLIDVKSTKGSFDQPLHISYRELREMAENEQYNIYRVHFVKNKERRRINISGNMKDFANSVLEWFKTTPVEIIPDSISLAPSTLNWDVEIEFMCEIENTNKKQEKK